MMTDVLVDGTWTLRWPKVTAWGPPIALVAGALIPLVWLREEIVFTQSLLFMILAVVIGIMSGTSALAFVSGFVLSDFFFGISVNQDRYSPVMQFVMRNLARVVPYLLLVLLAIVIPRLARRVAAPVGAGTSNRGWRRAIGFGVAVAVLVFLWSQAAIILITPAFTWLRDDPIVEAIKPMQSSWPWLVAAAAAAGVVRMRLEGLTLDRHPRIRQAVIAAARWQARSRPSWRDRLPVALRIGLIAVVMTLLLAGTYVHVIDAVIVAAVVGTLEAWRLGVTGDRAHMMGRQLRRLPFLVRAGLTLVLGFLAGWWLARTFWVSDSLRATALGAVVTLVLAYLLVVPLNQRRRPT
jgi:hypothetical protein